MDYQYLFNLICQRRGVTLSKVESIFVNVFVTFGLADGTALFAAAVNTFYYFDSMNIVTAQNTSITGAPLIRFTNSGQGSAGNNDLKMFNQLVYPLRGVETDSVTYILNTHTAGAFQISGAGFKITYTV
jgi:hypothetical protein